MTTKYDTCSWPRISNERENAITGTLGTIDKFGIWTFKYSANVKFSEFDNCAMVI